MQEHIQAIATVLSLVNPAICGMMFVEAESGSSRGQRLVDATKATLVVLVILVVAALVGTRLLHLFGIWSRAGGCWHGWDSPCSAARQPHRHYPLRVRTRSRHLHP